MKILLLEDNKKLAQSLKKGFEQESYTVDILHDGMEAERRILNHSIKYDLVILDVMLPGKTGLEICIEVRQQNVIVPILMLTAKDTLEDRVVGLDSGADDYLVKPFAFEELLARVRALLRRPKEVIPDAIRLGTLELQSSSKQLMVAGQLIPLTLREFKILEYLMRHSNQVMTRDQILNNVWEFSFGSGSNVVDVHIKNLRKKIGTTHEYHLETLRGLGYRFKV